MGSSAGRSTLRWNRMPARPPSNAPIRAARMAAPMAMAPTAVTWPSLTGSRGRFSWAKMSYWVPAIAATAGDQQRDHDSPQPHRETLPKPVEPGHPAGDVSAAVVGEQQHDEQRDRAHQSNGLGGSGCRLRLLHRLVDGRCWWRRRTRPRPPPARRSAVRPSRSPSASRKRRLRS